MIVFFIIFFYNFSFFISYPWFLCISGKCSRKE